MKGVCLAVIALIRSSKYAVDHESGSLTKFDKISPLFYRRCIEVETYKKKRTLACPKMNVVANYTL